MNSLLLYWRKKRHLERIYYFSGRKKNQFELATKKKKKISIENPPIDKTLIWHIQQPAFTNYKKGWHWTHVDLAQFGQLFLWPLTLCFCSWEVTGNYMGGRPSIHIAALSGRAGIKTTNQEGLPFLVILLSWPLEEPENLESVEKTHGLGRSGIFQPMLFLSHDQPKKKKKRKSLEECFSFFMNPKMPHLICLKFSRKLLLWHKIIYMKCKTDWFVVLAKMGRKANWIAFLKISLGSHLWITTY